MPEIHESQKLRNRSRVFADRVDAGGVLGRMLEPVYGGREDVTLLGIPMGGVPVALKIAGMLKCPWDLLVVRKIQIPGNTEAGFGAMTCDGDVFFNEALMARLGLTEVQIRRQSDLLRSELAERNERLRRGRPLPELAGRTVLLVDDGLASGFTMKAAVFQVKRRRAARAVVAAPTASPASIQALADGPDEIYCANLRETLSFAVADAYRNWRDLAETEVLALLSGARGAGR